MNLVNQSEKHKSRLKPSIGLNSEVNKVNKLEIMKNLCG